MIIIYLLALYGASNLAWMMTPESVKLALKEKVKEYYHKIWG